MKMSEIITMTKEELNKNYVSVKLYNLAKAFHDEKCAEFAKLCYDYNKLEKRLERIEQEAIKKVLNKLLSYEDFLLHADENGHLLYVDFSVWIDEIAKQCVIKIGE